MKLSEKNKQEIIENLNNNVSIKDICDKYFVSKATIYRLKKEILNNEVSNNEVSNNEISNNDITNNDESENDNETSTISKFNINEFKNELNNSNLTINEIENINDKSMISQKSFKSVISNNNKSISFR